MTRQNRFELIMSAVFCVVIFSGGWTMGCLYASKPAPYATHVPVTVHVDTAPALEIELERCQALTKAQVEILDDDRKLEEGICNRRVEALVRETYPKKARLILRSGQHLRGDVQWFVGEGAPPKDTCDKGSLYSRTDVGILYVCEGGAWRAKP